MVHVVGRLWNGVIVWLGNFITKTLWYLYMPGRGEGVVTKLFDTSASRVIGPPTWPIGCACSCILLPCLQLGGALRLCHFLSAPVPFHLLAVVLMIASCFPFSAYDVCNCILFWRAIIAKSLLFASPWVHAGWSHPPLFMVVQKRVFGFNLSVYLGRLAFLHVVLWFCT